MSEQQPLTITLSYTAEDNIRAARLLRPQLKLTWRHMVGLLGLVVLVLITLSEKDQVLLLFIVGSVCALGGCCGCLLLLVIVRKARLEKLYKTHPYLVDPRRFVFSEDALDVISEKHSTHMEWSLFSDLKEDAAYFVFGFANVLYFVPKRAIPDLAVQMHLRLILEQKIGPSSAGKAKPIVPPPPPHPTTGGRND